MNHKLWPFLHVQVNMCFLGGPLWWLTEQRNPKIIAKHTEWYNKFGCKQWSRYPCKVPQQLVLKSHRFAKSFPVSRGLFTLVFGGRGEKRPTNYSKRRCSVVGVIRKADVNQSKKSHIKTLCRIFFSVLISLQDFFSSKKGQVFTYPKCIYIYIVVIAVIVLIWSCKALKCCMLYKIIIG